MGLPIRQGLRNNGVAVRNKMSQQRPPLTFRMISGLLRARRARLWRDAAGLAMIALGIITLITLLTSFRDAMARRGLSDRLIELQPGGTFEVGAPVGGSAVWYSAK